MEKKKEPIERIRIGRVTAAIWQNESQNGQWYNVTLTRSYKEGDEYRDSHSLAGTDILLGAAALERAFALAGELQKGEKA